MGEAKVLVSRVAFPEKCESTSLVKRHHHGRNPGATDFIPAVGTDVVDEFLKLVWNVMEPLGGGVPRKIGARGGQGPVQPPNDVRAVVFANAAHGETSIGAKQGRRDALAMGVDHLSLIHI